MKGGVYRMLTFKVDFQEKSGQVNFGKIRFKP